MGERTSSSSCITRTIIYNTYNSNAHRHGQVGRDQDVEAHVELSPGDQVWVGDVSLHHVRFRAVVLGFIPSVVRLPLADLTQLGHDEYASVDSKQFDTVRNVYTFEKAVWRHLRATDVCVQYFFFTVLHVGLTVDFFFLTCFMLLAVASYNFLRTQFYQAPQDTTYMRETILRRPKKLLQFDHRNETCCVITVPVASFTISALCTCPVIVLLAS